MLLKELAEYKDQHGRLIFINKLGCECTLFGYIREINGDHVIFEDNEKPDKFKIINIKSFVPMKLKDW
jgi:ferredoxin-fold anticodon binding domain-containing protein